MRSILIVSMAVAGAAWADTITLNGKTYEDVLVYETPRSYYVCIPEEGKALRAPVDEVDASSVKIIKDAVYRSERQAVYNEVKSGGRPKAAPNVSIDPNAPTVIEGNANNPPRGTEALMGGGAATGGGLGVSLQQLQAQIQGAGLKFSESGPGRWSAKNDKGNFTVAASGSAENLQSLQFSVSGSMQEIQGLMVNMGTSLATAVPWADQVMPEVQQQLMSNPGQPVTIERDGVRLQIQGGMGQGGINVNASVTAI